jgi:hypothetical protein
MQESIEIFDGFVIGNSRLKHGLINIEGGEKAHKIFIYSKNVETFYRNHLINEGSF